jgi:hypothetical protein
MTWESEFRRRMNRFRASLPSEGNGVPLSIKLRVSSGCFHREHSPYAYRVVDEYLRSHPPSDFAFEEHESGPELLVYLSLVTAAVSLTANVINFITAIIKARTEGMRHGDRPGGPIELVVRGFDGDGKLMEERILRMDSWHDVSEDVIEKALLDSTSKMILKGTDNKTRGVSQ